MKVALQRVTQGKVIVNDQTIASIKDGLVILLGVEKTDNHEKANTLAKKIANLRIFNDENGKMNLSLLNIGGEAIVVSQFTLMADTHKGNRPSFINAAPPGIASPLVDYFSEALCKNGVPTQKGEFGAHMQVELTNDGPVTIWLEF